MCCDDGLFYSDVYIDFVQVVQDHLDKHGIGAYLSLPKSSWVKRDGVWLTNLKLVGLVYNPFTDVLSASTRNGATMELVSGAYSFFSEETCAKGLIPFTLPKDIIELDFSQWKQTNQNLFELYERLYLLEGYPSAYVESLLDNLTLLTSLLMKKRLAEYS
jgi:hypothetical protein